MSLVGARTAVVSIGLSCQTAMQLRKHQARVSRLLDEPMEYRSSFFNYLLCDRRAVARLFERLHDHAFWEGDFINTGHHPLEIADLGLSLWHDWQAGPEAAASKFRSLAAKMRDLRRKERRVFVVSNTQNNLDDEVVNGGGRRDFTMDYQTMQEIRAAVGAAFPVGRNEVHFVLRRERAAGVAPGRYFSPAEDDTPVEGDTRSWEEFLDLVLPREPCIC